MYADSRRSCYSHDGQAHAMLSSKPPATTFLKQILPGKNGLCPTLLVLVGFQGLTLVEAESRNAAIGLNSNAPRGSRGILRSSCAGRASLPAVSSGPRARRLRSLLRAGNTPAGCRRLPPVWPRPPARSSLALQCRPRPPPAHRPAHAPSHPTPRRLPVQPCGGRRRAGPWRRRVARPRAPFFYFATHECGAHRVIASVCEPPKLGTA